LSKSIVYLLKQINRLKTFILATTHLPVGLAFAIARMGAEAIKLLFKFVPGITAGGSPISAARRAKRRR
jgi:hypothetical protein